MYPCILMAFCDFTNDDKTFPEAAHRKWADEEIATVNTDKINTWQTSTLPVIINSLNMIDNPTIPFGFNVFKMKPSLKAGGETGLSSMFTEPALISLKARKSKYIEPAMVINLEKPGTSVVIRPIPKPIISETKSKLVFTPAMKGNVFLNPA